MGNAPLILINGWPGVGKQTVAEMLALLLGEDKAHLVDDNNFVGTVHLPHGHPDFEKSKREDRDTAFANFVEDASSLGKITIFTDCQADTIEGRSVAQEYEATAARSNRALIPIYLDCQLEENLRRVQTLERRTSLKDKIRSPKEARSVRNEGGRLFVFPDHNGLTLNITNMAPGEAAISILGFMNDEIARRDTELANAETTPLEGQEPDWLHLDAR
ncbi:hypothetical protein UCRPA7_5889 [Phaeoacremonium minimum UCRPA7]|uniref:Uncharacterized protein n=1 Tax=Phaeoacremonium minimum (strain UCR-PA7) TaxID=1286976 RepID=R8BH18_PHAM7|nr:hypothetical protein UCRPA7_5889 [Phaeoacremonium minimum UCRPA7]EON98532.1 hypothetical protein UCRPA7_5889 [Phaeoacremonium minimum UCRPA7]